MYTIYLKLAIKNRLKNIIKNVTFYIFNDYNDFNFISKLG